jgi:superfamily II DNA or RNA helicase
MLILHASWSLPLAELQLWAEDPSGSLRARGRPKRGDERTVRPHPFAAHFEDVGRVVRPLLDGYRQPEDLEVEDCTVLLPSEARGPRRSPWLVPDELADPGPASGLAPWSVPALLLPADVALFVLERITEPGERLASAGFLPSVGLRCLAEVARLARHLADRGSIAPAIVQEHDEWIARWIPAVLTTVEHQALVALADALPPSACATLPWGEEEPPEDGWAGLPVATPTGVVRSALKALTDQCVRRRLRDASARPGDPAAPLQPRPARGDEVGPALLGRALLVALADSYPAFEHAQEGEINQLRDRLASWRAATGADAPYRTCFRVVPPTDEGDPPTATDAPAESWSIEFELQLRDDPSLMLPAPLIWAGQPVAAELVAGGPDPQEHLLASLGMASRLHRPLEAALLEPAPSRLTTDAEGVWAFLRDGGPLLEEAGFGVLAPTWWGDRTSGLGLRLRARSSSPADVSGGELCEAALLRFEWRVALGTDEISEQELRAIAAAKVPLVRLRGRWVEVRAQEVAAALALLEKAPPEGQPISAIELLRLGLGLDSTEEGLPVLGVDADGPLGELLTGDAKLRLLRTPASFEGSLRPYQRRGLAWLSFLESCGLGACLADDMGLGKTIQVLVLLAKERAGRKAKSRAGRPGPTLLICPLSVVGNWRSEAARFVPGLDVYVHHGPDRLSGDALTQRMAVADLAITTFALAARDHETLAEGHWHRVVVDEAQAIKNRDTRQSRAIRGLTATRRIALTGTPVENRLSELHSIMDFLNPGLLGSVAAYRRSFVLPIERDHMPEASERLQRLVQPFLLRRLKTDETIALDLPDKIERRVECRLTREQATLYQAVVDELEAAMAGAEGMQRRGAILAAMTRLKQACNHPAQLLGDGSEIAGRSGKLRRTEALLDEALAVGDKALIFTQYAAMGRLLRTRLQARFGQEVLLLYGGTSKAARDRMVARFQEASGPRLFILSIKAGGTGLNLTAANHVIHFDRWWNPAVEDQATDRAYRIGQHRNVQVHKLVCVGTMEERIDAMIVRKKALADRVVGSGEEHLTELSSDQLRAVVALAADAVEEG